MPAGLLFTDSELCALHRIRDLALPRFVTESDADDVRLDVTALRGLAARELVAFDSGEDVWISPALGKVVEPCREPGLVAELEIESAGVIGRHAVIATTDGRLTVFSERPWGLVSVERYDAGPGDVLERLAGLDRIVDGGHNCLTVPSHAYLRADDLLATGSPDAAVDVLVSAGASLPAAHAWLLAVSQRRTTVLVNVARNLGTGPGGPFIAVELGWLQAADGTAWQITAAESGEGVDWDTAEPDRMTTLRQVGAGVLRDALADICEPDAVGTVR